MTASVEFTGNVKRSGERMTARRNVRRRTLGYTAPLVVVMALTTLFPVGYAVYLSFFNWNWGTRFNFVGVANYRALLTDSTFWAAMGRTGLFTTGAVIVELVLGMVLALAAHSTGSGVGVIRSVLIIPLMVSGIIVSVVWKVMLDNTLGVIPWALGQAHIPVPNFLGSSSLALWTIVGIDAWWQTAFVFIILSAGLAGLSNEPFEAATVDGASARQRFGYITLPLLRPLIVTVALIRMVDCLKVFAIIFGTTNGGPGRSTESAQMLAYRSGFKELAMSRSMTIMTIYAVMVIALVGIGALVWRRSSRDR